MAQLAHAGSGSTRLPRRAAAASFFGSMVEFFDFFIYGSASALVFSHVFFSNLAPSVGTLVSLATFAAAYLARPIGSLIVGQLGDRLGRKRVLVYTLVVMGSATFLVGCLPTYAMVGGWAPVLLIALRILQGLSASGEQSGAASLTMEHSPEGRRAFFTSFTLAGTVTGLIVANLAVLPIAALPDSDLYTWGWRIPFWASAIVVVIAMLIRRTLEEPAEFVAVKEKQEVVRFPLAVFLRHYWRQFIIIQFALMFSATFTAFNVFALSYAPQVSSLTSSQMLWVVVIANVVHLAMIPLWARLSDRIGRKPVFVIGCVGVAASVFLYFAAISTGSWWFVLIAGVIMTGLFYSAPNSIYFVTFTEMFDVRVRFTGVAVSSQFAALLQGFAPTIAAAIILPGAMGWFPVAILLSALCVAAASAILFARETAFTPLQRLGAASRQQSEEPATGVDAISSPAWQPKGQHAPTQLP